MNVRMFLLIPQSLKKWKHNLLVFFVTKGRLRKDRPPMEESSPPTRDPEWEEGLDRVGEFNGPTHYSVPMKETVQALVSVESESDEEDQCFEIKRRPPSSLPKGKSVATPRGRVCQVVAAFRLG
ncbi:unnamed protein product [Linum trigynum]